MVRNEDTETDLLQLASILLVHIEDEPQPRPYLIKDGVKIIL
ncbi:MAG: hypothetical protein PVI21_01635 [Candidatus Woesebacteria bacterium]|jgi:hypothetical protein